MDDPIRFSIVIPSFNQAHFIERTLNSVLGQGVPVEVIVIDGGSTDETVEILRRHEERLAHWISEPDRGQTHAINKGMARATGDLRGYLNSDDVLLPGALDAIARAHAENPDADLFHGRCITIDENDAPLPRRFFSDIETAEDILDLWRVWYAGRNFVQPEVFWTRRMAEKIGPFDESRHYAMDYDYWCRAIIAGAKVHRIDRDIAAFRIWSQQKSSAAEKAAQELRDIAIKHIRDPKVRLSPHARRRLRGDWAFDEIYSRRGGELSKQSPIRRRLGMAGAAFRSPELLFSPNFRSHGRRIMQSWWTAKQHPEGP